MSLTKVTNSMIKGAFYNALDYGAVADCNGTTGTDNFAAFALAYAAVKATGGTLFIPKGNYYTSGLVGSNPNNGSDLAHNVTILGESGAIITVASAYAGGTVVGLQGNNVAVRNLKVTSVRTLDYRAALTPQRTPYQIGIYVGGKQDDTLIGSFYSGAQVTNCTVTNMNLPINVNCTGTALVRDNVVDEFTDTGILINDCTTDIWVLNNKVSRGGDDCFFARHYSTSAYALAGNFIGRITVDGNTFDDTFGKNAGFGGYGEIIFTNNICSLSWAGGVNLENTWGGQLNQYNYQNVLIANNEFWNSGQNYTAAYPAAHISTPAPGENPSAIHTVYANLPANTYWYKNITITNNKITNPNCSAIALSAVKNVSISGNTWAAGNTDHGAGSVATSNAAVTINTASDIVVTGNTSTNPLTQLFNYIYSLATGTGPIASIKIVGNVDNFATGAIAFSDGGAVSATSFNSYDYASGGTRMNLVSYTYANLPAGASTGAYTSSLVYCTNGRKVGEGGGAGTGVPVYYANGAWRVFATDAAVAI